MSDTNGRNGGRVVNLIRDVVAIGLAAALLWNEMLTPGPADPVATGAALVLLGGAAALRLDERK